jgi:predicted Zn-dependent protease
MIDKLRRLFMVLLLVAWVVCPPGPIAGAQTRSLPKAGFPVLTRPAQGEDSDLPVVSGVHLQEGKTRRQGQGVRPYDPGEPSLNGALVRWNPRDPHCWPLRVWISPGSKLPDVPFAELMNTRVQLVSRLIAQPGALNSLTECPGFQQEMYNAVGYGIEQWKDMENEGVIKFVYTTDPYEANVLIFFVDHFLGAAGPGGTDVHGNTVGTVYPADGLHQLSIKGQARPYTPIVIELKLNNDLEKLQAEAAHEFGHALGIKAHSAYREDIMYENRIVETLSPADKATLRALYRSTPKYWY